MFPKNGQYEVMFMMAEMGISASWEVYGRSNINNIRGIVSIVGAGNGRRCCDSLWHCDRSHNLAWLSSHLSEIFSTRHTIDPLLVQHWNLDDASYTLISTINPDCRPGYELWPDMQCLLTTKLSNNYLQFQRLMNISFLAQEFTCFICTYLSVTNMGLIVEKSLVLHF